MFGILAWLAGSKIGRAVIGVAIIAFFIFGFRIWLVAHDSSVAREARAGYVLMQEKLAAEALANEYRRQLLIAQQIREQAELEAEQLEIQAQERRDADEKAIADDEGNDGPRVDAGDIEFLRKSRQATSSSRR